MDWSQHPDPLKFSEELKETRKSNAALRDYALMGPGRNIRDLHVKYVEQKKWWAEQRLSNASAEKPPTANLGTMFAWSDDYDWVARVKRWDELRAQREEEAFQQERIEWRKKRLQAAQGLFSLTAQEMTLLQEKLKPRQGPDGEFYPPSAMDDIELAKIARSLEIIHTELRREFGDDLQKVDVTSGGQPITIVEVVRKDG